MLSVSGATNGAPSSCPMTARNQRSRSDITRNWRSPAEAINVGKVDVNRMFAFGLAADAVDPSGPLFDVARVPSKVAVDHVATIVLKVYALSHHLALPSS